MSYLYVKWNSFGRGLLASGLAIKACRASLWPLPERRPATPQAARLGRSGGRGRGQGLLGQSHWAVTRFSLEDLLTHPSRPPQGCP